MDIIYCAAGNKRLAAIAIRYGFKYGAQLPATIYFDPYFADQDWKRPDRERYMQALAQHKPHLATVLDLEREEQLSEVMAWAEEAAEHVGEVLIIPKAFGVIDRIPDVVRGKPVRLAYSVPTKFGGTSVPVWEFKRRPVHLLGGSPHAQLAMCSYLNVVSADGNYAAKMALRWCQYYAFGHPTKWPLLKDELGFVEEEGPYVAFELSCMNIMAMWSGARAHYRFAIESDILAICQIASQYRQELGYVMPPALRESMARKTLIVAISSSGQTIGFVNYRARKDGGQTIYEIAVRKGHTGQRIGAGLLACVPKPLRLKCTQDNPANKFYAASGFELAGVDPGKKRPLNIWVKP